MKSRKFDESDFTSREVQENALVELDNNGKLIKLIINSFSTGDRFHIANSLIYGMYKDSNNIK